MEIELPKDVNKKLLEVANLMDLGEEEIVNRALLIYLDNIQKYLVLKKETKAWDEMSDEALDNFERDL